MIINNYDPSVLHEAFGIDMCRSGASRAFRAPEPAGDGSRPASARSCTARRDRVLRDRRGHRASSWSATGAIRPSPARSRSSSRSRPMCCTTPAQSDLLFVTQYWRDAERALEASPAGRARRLRRPSGLRLLHPAHPQRRPAPGPPLRAVPGRRRLRPLPADERHPGLAPHRQRRLPELRGRRRRPRRTHPGPDRRALQRGDRRHPPPDGHPAGPVHRHQRGRLLPARPAGLLLPPGGVRPGRPEGGPRALRRRQRRLPLRGRRQGRLPDLRHHHLRQHLRGVRRAQLGAPTWSSRAPTAPPPLRAPAPPAATPWRCTSSRTRSPPTTGSAGSRPGCATSRCASSAARAWTSASATPPTGGCARPRRRAPAR